MASCNEFVKQLGNLLDNEVADGFDQQLESHLVQCSTCQVLFDSARKTMRIVMESNSFAYPEPVPDPLVNKVMSRIRCRERIPE